ncbi:phospholipase D-like domain-containing protein [Nocardioides dongxiaopingii]|uniref:phospholipase D-like domain-containing protein n=1 Tax=Nocardioides dongxiaopingii TaxID=2576036 RepID=UPI0010C76D36|nr:phospholipase D-like domain-containing protein [Nocardioides dongxiaopingii]
MAKLLALIVAVAALSVPASPTSASAPDPAGKGGRGAVAGAEPDAFRAPTPDNFNPRPGATFNSPVGGVTERRTIFRKIIRSIDSTPKGEQINFFTWNFLTSEGTDALLRAQGRGVRVRLLMDNRNNVEIPNQPFRRLKAELAKNNKKRKDGVRSWARVCKGSCRGGTGSSHSKFFMFSRAGKVPRVVMQGSANLTLASTNNQWNDVYTHTRSKNVWRFYSKIFRESSKDRRAAKPYVSQRFESGFRLIQFPMATSQDPVMQLLNQVRCSGAKNTASGRTRIRIAPDVIRQDRGMRLGKKVRALWNNGCDIQIGYTVLGIDVGRMLRAPGPRGPVPLRHLVQDVDDDGEFDNYFHLKAMSVVGKLGKDASAYAVLNGSANWSGLSAVSDENLGVYRSKRDTLRYESHIQYWYGRFGSASARTMPSFRGATTPPSGDRLVFGSGPNAVYEDGTPYSTTGVDPYANMTGN